MTLFTDNIFCFILHLVNIIVFVDIRRANLFCYIDIADLVFVNGIADCSFLVNVSHTLVVFNVLHGVLIVVVRVSCLGPTGRG